MICIVMLACDYLKTGGLTTVMHHWARYQGVARASTAPPRYTALAAPAAKSLSVGLNQEEIATKNSKNIPSKLNSQELPKLINTFQKIESK